MKMHADNRPKLGGDTFWFPVESVNAELEIQAVKELVVSSVRTDKEFTDLEAVYGCAVVVE